MPLGIEIVEHDIADAEGLLGVSFDDTNRREAILCTDTADVQACPGSGKTTLLIGKLAILAGKWSWKDQGICVLSHTNAARHEVEERLANYPAAHKLLRYPHFIGTIQTFVNRFLALPSLREMGLEVTMVDNNRLADKAERLLDKFYGAKAYLGKRRNGLDIVRELRFEGHDLGLGSAAGEIPCGPTTRTYKELEELKECLCKEGLFRYDDMYAFASRYIARHPWAVLALRRRFPWVFIDEMQDTDSLQDGLLTNMFSEGCVLQRFGDSNQAIFWGVEVDSQTSFPKGTYLSLPDSKRFGQGIADFAAPLTQAVSPQELVGSHRASAKKHTLFLFDANTISCVLPAFGNLLATEFSKAVPPGFTAKAIGFRKTPPTDADSDKIPFSIGHYHPGFDPRLSLKSARPSCLVGFARKARHLRAQTGECKEASDMLFAGILELLYLAEVTDSSGQRFTKTRLADALAVGKNDSLVRLRAVVSRLILADIPADSDGWQAVVDELTAVLAPLLPEGIPNDVEPFLEWVDALNQPSGDQERQASAEPNVYRHNGPTGTINIELSTIHGVKGQTHTATLVLETFDRTHDLKKVLKSLKGGNAGNAPPVKHMKRVFVAMTRPRELLCLAMRRDHLSPKDVAALTGRGWTICDLTDGREVP